MNLSKKIIVITWSSDWIWKEVALRLAKENATVLCVSRNMQKLEKVCEEALKQWAHGARAYACDVSKTEQLEKTIQQIVNDFWGIDILINNAWIWQKLAPLESIEQETVESVLQTNLVWLIQCTRLFLPTLHTRDEAAIINISSKAWVTAQEWLSVYTASKYWVRGFTEVLKTDLKESNIRVAWVYQSGTNTQMFNKTGEDFPIEKFTDPKDLADVIAYMLGLPKKIWLHDVRVEF